jgi:hypothetical protein
MISIMSRRDVGTECPDWWPYAAEFPLWSVWRDVDRLYYARRQDYGPGDCDLAATVRGEDPVDLRDQIRAVLLRPARS